MEDQRKQYQKKYIIGNYREAKDWLEDAYFDKRSKAWNIEREIMKEQENIFKSTCIKQNELAWVLKWEEHLRWHSNKRNQKHFECCWYSTCLSVLIKNSQI